MQRWIQGHQGKHGLVCINTEEPEAMPKESVESPTTFDMSVSVK